MDIIPLKLPLPDSRLKEEYAGLIPQAFLSCLEGKDPFEIKAPVIGVGAVQGGHPLGVAFATVHTKIQTAHIHLIALQEVADSQKIASHLLKALEKILEAQKVAVATFTYTKEDALAPILEKSFVDNRWQGPRLLMIECLFKRADFDPPWWYKKMNLEEGFEEFLFKNLTSHEQKDILRRTEQMSIPSHVLPLGREKHLIEYQNSLGLRYKGKVVGWMITHRIAPDVIRYSALYLEDEFAYSGYWLKLLVDALKIQKKMLDATYGMLEINVEQISTRWLKFIERRLFPHTCKIIHKEMFWKSLKK